MWELKERLIHPGTIFEWRIGLSSILTTPSLPKADFDLKYCLATCSHCVVVSEATYMLLIHGTNYYPRTSVTENVITVADVSVRISEPT